jgi:hypothetical protein
MAVIPPAIAVVRKARRLPCMWTPPSRVLIVLIRTTIPRVFMVVRTLDGAPHRPVHHRVLNLGAVLPSMARSQGPRRRAVKCGPPSYGRLERLFLHVCRLENSSVIGLPSGFGFRNRVPQFLLDCGRRFAGDNAKFLSVPYAVSRQLAASWIIRVLAPAASSAECS